mmetsp:Transcript_46647/g.75025  ORF Transcript_46647/g.75025 Transcript_46647/m.75025 type:complete len:214 (+) Transcript_46647:70-711(+)
MGAAYPSSCCPSCCCCCPTGLVYQEIKQTFDADWEGVELTSDEINDLQMHLEDDLDNIDFDEDGFVETVEELENLEKELEEAEDGDSVNENEPQMSLKLDPHELQEDHNLHQGATVVKAIDPPPNDSAVTAQDGGREKITQEPRPTKLSRREAREIKERTRTNMLKKNVQIEAPIEHHSHYNIESLLDEDEEATEGWDAEAFSPVEKSKSKQS